jgi:ATP-dependent HslUV protease subunit HslV
VRRGSVVVGGDGQVSMGNTIMKGNARKVRRLYKERSLPALPAAPPTRSRSSSCSRHSWKSTRGSWCAPPWSSPRPGARSAPCASSRRCWLVADRDTSLVISGNGDVIEPEHDLIAIGSGGSFAQAAALALIQNTELDARDIVEKSLSIAADICIYTNQQRTIEQLDY